MRHNDQYRDEPQPIGGPAEQAMSDPQAARETPDHERLSYNPDFCTCGEQWPCPAARETLRPDPLTPGGDPSEPYDDGQLRTLRYYLNLNDPESRWTHIIVSRLLATIAALRTATPNPANTSGLRLCDDRAWQAGYGCALPVNHEKAGIRGHHWVPDIAHAALRAATPAEPLRLDPICRGNTPDGPCDDEMCEGHDRPAEPGLDTAWAEAETLAKHTGWTMYGLSALFGDANEGGMPNGRWEAEVVKPQQVLTGEGPTPAAALRALAARLREDRP